MNWDKSFNRSRIPASTELSEHTDLELYAMLSGGGSHAHQALSMLYKRHSPRIYSYVRKILGDVQATDDIFQETFVRFYEMGVSGQDIQNVQGYLLKISRNLCLNEKAKKYNTSTITIENFEFPSLDTPYEQKELSRLISTALEMLPEDYKEVLILREMYGYSYNEIAEIVETSMPIVRTRIYRAKQKIRVILQPFIDDLYKH
ncbi:MAG: RNA polymerase sigma factor [Candidatus Kapaibacteriota bacterium]|jgi:RNA polymerase sigma-70 factor (ECF subfamily)